jgi:hypothetical protein
MNSQPSIVFVLIAQFLNFSSRASFFRTQRAILHACSTPLAWKHVDARLVVQLIRLGQPAARVEYGSWSGFSESVIIQAHRPLFLGEYRPTFRRMNPMWTWLLDLDGKLNPVFCSRIHALLPIELWIGTHDDSPSSS